VSGFGIMTCGGSEANDIALRMAQAVTGKSGVIATDHTYHGNTDFRRGVAVVVYAVAILNLCWVDYFANS